MISKMEAGWCISIDSFENDADFRATNFIWGIESLKLLDQFMVFLAAVKEVDTHSPTDEQMKLLLSKITLGMWHFIGYDYEPDEEIPLHALGDFLGEINLDAMNYEYYFMRKIYYVQAKYIHPIVTRDKAFFSLGKSSLPYSTPYQFLENQDDNNI